MLFDIFFFKFMIEVSEMVLDSITKNLNGICKN